MPKAFWELISPKPLVLFKLCLQVIFDDLINGLNLTVGIGMIN